MQTSPIPPSLAAELDREIDRLQPELIEIRHHLHQNPELSWHERETMAFLSDQLGRHSIEHRTGISGTGLVIDIDTGRDGSRTAFRADMDALPVMERTGLAYS